LTRHGIRDSEVRRRYAQIFDDVAEEYDRERRGYPESLIDAACHAGALIACDRVVEVGCGTGLLTTALLRRGLSVDAVDPGANMIRIAKRRVGEGADVRFHQGRFEHVPVADAAFAAVFSATAFHWIEPAVGWARAATLLRPGGVLALLQYCDVWDAGTLADWQALLDAVGRVAPEIASTWPELRTTDTILSGAHDRRHNISDVWSWIGRHDMTAPEALEQFRDVEVASVPVYTEQTGDQVNAYLRTTSLYARIDPDRRSELEAENRRIAERHGGVVRTSELAVLVTGRRVQPGLR
jgi:SAM-dependent methyltransferase